MRYFAQFYAKDNSGKLTEMLGSDGVMPLDARLCTYNMIQRVHRNKLVKHGATHFKIMKTMCGRYSEAFSTSDLIPLRDNYG